MGTPIKMMMRAAVAMTFAMALLLAVPASAAHLRRGPTSQNSLKSSSKSKGSSKPAKVKKTKAGKQPAGPRAIDDARATQIQTALIKAGYLTGEPTGHWDSASQSAMEKLQGDNGWQTKLIPDSRALIKLGLGPGAADAAAPNVPAAPAAGTTPAKPAEKIN